MPAAPRRADLGRVLDAVEKLSGRIDQALDHIKAARKSIDRLSLPEGCLSHPDFDEQQPLWLLEKYRDGRPLGVYFPINLSTVAGSLVPTRRTTDALRFVTRDAAERFIASDRRLAVFRIVPDRTEPAALDDDEDDAPDLFR
jgi:hypothetical protein